VSVVWLLARARIRRSWPALVVLGILAGVVGGVVLGSVAAARRTTTAYDRLRAVTHAPDAIAAATDTALLDEMLQRPAVTRSWVGKVSVGKVERSEPPLYIAVLSGPARPGLLEPEIVEGRAADPGRADEVVVNEAVTQFRPIHVGDALPLDFLSDEQFRTWGDEEFRSYDGPEVRLRVVGVGRYPIDQDSFGATSVLATPAFWHRYAATAGGSPGALLQLRPGADPDAVAAPVRARAASTARADVRIPSFRLITFSNARRSAQQAAHVVVAGLLVLALIALAAGLIATGQALARHFTRSGDEDDRLRALGMTRGQRVGALVVPASLSVALSLPVMLAIAIVASPLSPVGSARRLEPEPGISVNVALLAAGAGVLLVLFALGAIATGRIVVGRSDRRSRSGAPSPTPTASGVGSASPVVTGIRFATDRGRGTSTTPVRPALAAGILGVIGVVAALVFATSLDRLVSTKERWGWPADFRVEVGQDRFADALRSVERDPDVADVAEVLGTDVDIEGRTAAAYGLTWHKGQLGWTLLSGRLPSTPAEIVLGSRLSDQTGAGVGDNVRLDSARAGEAPLTYRVVGIGLGPTGDTGPFDGSVALTADGLARVQQTTPYRSLYIKVARGADPAEVRRRDVPGLEAVTPELPTPVRNLDQVDRLPWILAGVLAVLGAAAMAHALLLTVRRRRRDLAVLRTLGYTPAQCGRAIAAMATTTAVVSVVVGVPVGLAVGRTVWRLVADGIHVAGDPAVPAAALAVTALVVLAGAVAVAAVPGRTAARLKPADVLRSE
jgi:hypothetical protein